MLLQSRYHTANRARASSAPLGPDNFGCVFDSRMRCALVKGWGERLATHFPGRGGGGSESRCPTGKRPKKSGGCSLVEIKATGSRNPSVLTPPWTVYRPTHQHY